MQNSFFSDEEMGAKSYRVLARKYRPSTFKDMVGQEVLVRTLTNAIQSGRIAHAFVLTGIRGVGKTTTARIIARALNCIGPEGDGNPTIDPCGVCVHCKAISEDNHQDVLEMDAASHTGVNDIREIIENTRYRPTSARHKIYIIDEVHMLSNSAFNALLKTLEEPPAHVIFIFATTEIRKIPITILSRCQRFDLKRVGTKDLVGHFNNILTQEGLKAEDDALKLIANVASGSVRDGLSILDQALAFNSSIVSAESVREMLGLADTAKLYELYEDIVHGNIQNALSIVDELYRKGADPSLIIIDLLNINHSISKLKLSDTEADNLAELEKEKCRNLSKALNIPYLARLWQMLQKGLEETKTAYTPFAALEMLVIRITHASSLPTPEEIIKKLDGGNEGSNDGGNAPVKPYTAANTNSVAPASQGASHNFTSYEQIVNSSFEHDEMMVYHHLKTNVQFVSLSGNVLSIRLLADAPRGFPSQLQDFLSKTTNQKWQVLASTQSGSDTIASLEKSKEQNYINDIVKNDSVQSIMSAFGDLEIVDIKNKKIV